MRQEEFFAKLEQPLREQDWLYWFEEVYCDPFRLAELIVRWKNTRSTGIDVATMVMDDSAVDHIRELYVSSIFVSNRYAGGEKQGGLYKTSPAFVVGPRIYLEEWRRHLLFTLISLDSRKPENWPNLQ